MKIAIYTRARAHAGITELDRQEKICRAWAEEKGHEVVEVVRTITYGPDDRRPYSQLVKTLHKGQCEGIIASSATVYSNRVAEFLKAREEAGICMVRVFTVEPDYEYVDRVSEILRRAVLDFDRPVPPDIVPPTPPLLPPLSDDDFPPGFFD